MGLVASFAAQAQANRRCSSNMATARSLIEAGGAPSDMLNDRSVLQLVRQFHYPKHSLEYLAARYCGDIAEPPPKPELGMLDKWRYESCQKEAAQAPTAQGVNVGLRLCREKFRQ